jgi:hypothetical protein
MRSLPQHYSFSRRRRTPSRVPDSSIDTNFRSTLDIIIKSGTAATKSFLFSFIGETKILVMQLLSGPNRASMEVWLKAGERTKTWIQA